MLNGNTSVATFLLRRRQKWNQTKAASMFHFNCVVTSRWLNVRSDTFYTRRRSLVYVLRECLCCAWDKIPQHPAPAVSTSSFRRAILSACSFSMVISLCSSHPLSSAGQSGVTLFMNRHEISHGSAVSRGGIIPMSFPCDIEREAKSSWNTWVLKEAAQKKLTESYFRVCGLVGTLYTQMFEHKHYKKHELLISCLL